MRHVGHLPVDLEGEADAGGLGHADQKQRRPAHHGGDREVELPLASPLERARDEAREGVAEGGCLPVGQARAQDVTGGEPGGDGPIRRRRPPRRDGARPRIGRHAGRRRRTRRQADEVVRAARGRRRRRAARGRGCRRARWPPRRRRGRRGSGRLTSALTAAPAAAAAAGPHRAAASAPRLAPAPRGTAKRHGGGLQGVAAADQPGHRDGGQPQAGRDRRHPDGAAAEHHLGAPARHAVLEQDLPAEPGRRRQRVGDHDGLEQRRGLDPSLAQDQREHVGRRDGHQRRGGEQDEQHHAGQLGVQRRHLAVGFAQRLRVEGAHHGVGDRVAAKRDTWLASV